MKPVRFPALALGLLLLLPGFARAAAPPTLSFEVSFTPQVRATPFTGRILVFTGTPQEADPRFWSDNGGAPPGYYAPEPFYALDVQQLPPGQSVRIDQNALGFPTPPSGWPGVLTRFQAVLDQAPDDWRIGTAAGNGYSLAVEAQPGDTPVRLVIDQLVPAPSFPESSTVKLVEIPSPSLTQFFGRPMSLRAAVVLPDGYLEAPEKRFPVIYLIPGWGLDHYLAPWLRTTWPNLVSKSGCDAVLVVLDPTSHMGHLSFSDSANFGPAATAMVEELVPAIDRTFRTIADPKARLLLGHSMGGWNVLWLQSTYPDLFGAVWSLSPVWVDFHNASGTDLYAPGANFFTDSQGQPKPVTKWLSDIETVRGHGGIIQCFEAMWGPRGPDGRPQPLYDRRTGAIDPAVLAYWRQYDIDQKLTSNWAVLGPKLAGKLHVYVGDQDDLSGAVALLNQSLAALGSDAAVEIIPGKDHGAMFISQDITTRVAAEMADRLRRAGAISAAGQ